MRQKKITFDTVREIGMTLPGVETGTAYGSPALKVKKKLMACVPTHRSAEPDSLVVRMDFDQRDALLAEAPEKYYVKEHYLGYPCVLVRMTQVSTDELRDLLGTAFRFVTAKKKRQ